MKWVFHHQWKVLAATAFFCGSVASQAAAQSITMTSPVVPVTVQEGDDFATNVLQNPWDFNDRRDIGWEEGFSGTSISASGGVWQGTNASTGAYVFPLFGGFAGSLFAEPLPGDTSLPRYGIKHPVDASKYTLLSYRLNQTARSAYAIYWATDGATYWPDGSKFGSSFDGVYHASQGVSNSGYKVYSFDMTNLAGSFEARAGSWSGNIIALRIDPSNGGGANSVLQFDWVRLVDPSSAPTMTISWARVGLNSSRLVTLYVDTDNSGFDGSPVAAWGDGTDPGTYSLKTAMFPPGDYYFYVRSQAGGGLATEALSGYSSRLRVTAAPHAVISAPTETSGDDYAETELGNAWDMSDSADIVNLPGSSWPEQWRQFLSHSFTGGVFQAVADLPWSHIGNLHTDAQIHLNVTNQKPIDTGKYRYLTYRMAVDATNFPTIADKVENGWVNRPVFWEASFDNDSGRPKAHPIYEDWHTYSNDLWDNTILESGLPWKGNAFIKHLRLDPLETTIYTWFFYDWVKLSAENYAENDQYTISWTLSDNDSSSFSTSIYYDTDNTGFDGTLITTLNSLSAGAQSYSWNTSGLADGARYYIYLVTSDGTNTSRVYSTVPVVIGEYVPTPRLTRVPYDYDGDGVSDPTVYRIQGGKVKKTKVCTKKKGKKKCHYVSKRTGGSGKFYVKRSTQGDYIQAWGTQNYTPVVGDFDGDTLVDYGTRVTKNGKYLWNIFLSGEMITYTVNKVGNDGDTTVVGDYDGDGKDEIAVYRDGLWTIRYRSGTTATFSWGIPGDRAVPGDYDGDGKADLAVFRPSDGSWWISNSSTGSPTSISFGVNGDRPVQGDWDADGRTDTAIWRPSTGTWYIRDIDSGNTSSYQFGLSTDIPVVGDFDGDGQLDLTVWRKSNGTFYHNNRNGSVTSVQHGKSSDVLPLNEAQGY